MAGRLTKLSWLTFVVLLGALVFALWALPGAALAVTPPSITGTVTDADTGDPIGGDGWAEAFRVTPHGYEWVSETYIGYSGTYSFRNLADGEYVIQVMTWGWPFARFGEWFDDKHTREEATGVHVVSGATAVVDFELDRVPALSEDVFEPDDAFKQAPLVSGDGTSARHTIHSRTDTDTVKFRVRSGSLYRVSATYAGSWWGYADVRVAAYGANRAALAGSTWGETTFVAEDDGYAFAQVKNEWGSTGFYDLAVHESEPATIAGKVTAEDTHDPIESVRVWLIRYSDSWWGGWSDWSDTSATDAQGDYAFGSLASNATYRIQFDTQKAPEYASEWYENLPNTYPDYEATPVYATPGNTTVANAELARAAKIGGTVTDDDTGKPIAGIAVALYAEGEGMSSYGGGVSSYQVGWADTDALGNYEVGSLAPGSYKIKFADEMSGYQHEWFEDRADMISADPVTVASGDDATVDAELAIRADAAAVRGTVRDRATDEPIGDIAVKVEPVGWTDSSGYHPSTRVGALFSGYSSGYWAYTASDGSYRVGGIGKDIDPSIDVNWRITFGDPHSGYLRQYYDDKPTAEEADPVTLERGEFFGASADLDANPDVAMLTGRVTDALTGSPIAGAWVGYAAQSSYAMSGYGWDMSGYGGWQSGYGMSGYHYFQTDEFGGYSARGVPKGVAVICSASDDDHVRVFHDGKPSAGTADPLTLDSGESRNVDFALRPWGQAEGQVTEDGTGRALAGITVEAYSNVLMSGAAWGSGVSSYLYATARTDKNGDYKFDELNPYATYKIQFADPGVEAHQGEWYDDKPTADAADEVSTPLSGAAQASASLARNADLGSVVGRITNKADGSPLGTIQIDVVSGTANPDGSVTLGELVDREHSLPDGTYRIGGLPAGQYYLNFSDSLGRVASQWFDNLPGGSDRPTPITVAGGADAAVANAVMYSADSTAPTTSDDAVASYFKSATITLSATDEGSGVKSINYSLDGNPAVVTNDSTATLTVTAAGAHEVAYSATDFADNTSVTTTRTFTVVAPGKLQGSVTSSGTPLGGVSVKVGTMDATLTVADGTYEVSDIEPGTYSVRFSKSGYATETASSVTINEGGTSVQNAALEALTFTIGSSAGPNGTISATQTVGWDVDATFTITPDAGYHVAAVLVDGQNQGALTSYVFHGVRADHTISATFAVNPVVKTPVTIKRYPGGSSVVFKRKRGVAKFTLTATFTTAGKRIARERVYLQSSSNGRSWRDYATLTTTSAGVASKAFRVKKKSTVYYRWYCPETAVHLKAYTSKQKVVVK